MKCVAIGALVGLAMFGGWGPSTQALPRFSPWQRAKDPSGEARRLILEFADHKREARDVGQETERARTERYKASASWLERVLGARLDVTTDVELLMLYGESKAYAGPNHLRGAQRALRRALQLAPRHPNAASAWNTLGRVEAALGQADSAQGAFERALELEWDLALRSGIQIEQGLLAMQHGALERAIERLATASEAAKGEPALWALAQWALGVAMDRALLGPEGANLAWRASQGRFGANGELDVLALSGLGLEADSEATYYRALALMGKAQGMPMEARVATLLDAKFLWLTHLREAGPTGQFAARVQYHLQKIDELTATPEDRASLERQARAPLDVHVDAGGLNPEDMIWPEELSSGDAFWAGDAGAPSETSETGR